MASFNKVILVGNMVSDPELKQTASAISVCNFRIAVNRRYTRADQGQPTVDFFDIVTWRQTAEFVCRFFKKGNPILICGQLQTRSWTDNQGQKRNTVEVVADEATFVAPPAGQNGAAPAPHEAQQSAAYTPSAYGAPAFNNTQGSNFEEIPGDESLPF